VHLTFNLSKAGLVRINT